MFQVTTLDVADPPRLDDGSVDWSQDFFGKRANLTVSGQLNAENSRHGLRQASTPSAPPSGRRTPTPSATPPSSG